MSEIPVIKSKIQEARWFSELINIEISESLETCANKVDAIEGLFLIYFYSKHLGPSGLGADEICLFNNFKQGGVLISDIILLQRRINDIINRIINKLKAEEVVNGTEWKPFKVWDYEVATIIVSKTMTNQRVYIEGMEFNSDFEIDGDKSLARWKPNFGTDRLIRVAEIQENFCDYFFSRFLDLIKNQPYTIFKHCRNDNCGKPFIHLSKKEKLYCSNACASQFLSKQRRKHDKKHNPEKYKRELEKNAERAHASYKRRIKHGKPKRNPYKHKPTEKED